VLPSPDPQDDGKAGSSKATLSREGSRFEVEGVLREETVQQVYQDSLCESAQVLRAAKKCEQQALREMEEAVDFMRQQRERKAQEVADCGGKTDALIDLPEDVGWNSEALEMCHHERELLDKLQKMAGDPSLRLGPKGRDRTRCANAAHAALRRELPIEETESTACCELDNENTIREVQEMQEMQENPMLSQSQPSDNVASYRGPWENRRAWAKPLASKIDGAHRHGGWLDKQAEPAATAAKGQRVILETTQIVPEGFECTWQLPSCCAPEVEEYSI